MTEFLEDNYIEKPSHLIFAHIRTQEENARNAQKWFYAESNYVLAHQLA